MRAYLRILRVPHMKPLFGAMLLARLPIGINALATVLFLREQTGSFAVAGTATGGLALGTALGAPFAARLVDRSGRGVLLLLAAGHASGLAGLLALGYAGAPTVALTADTVLTGMLLPPVSSVLRAIYARMLAGDAEAVRAAFALDSVLTETIFIAGPLLIAALVALTGPAAALGVSAAAVLTGATLFLATWRRSEPDGGPRAVRSASRLGALRAPGIRTLLLSMLPAGFGFGALEVALPAFASDHGRPEWSGLLIAIWSIASATGGLVYGARSGGREIAHMHVLVAVLLPLSFVPLVLAGSLVSMALLVVPAGLLVAPLIASRNELAGVVAPPGSQTEAYTWPLTALVGGIALGAAASGAIVEASGWRAAALCAVGAAAVGGAFAVARRGTLEPAVGS